MISAEERREDIAAYVLQHGQVRIDDLVAHFGVSRMTIHRHIEQLASQGVLRKLHGAVSAQPSSVYESAYRYRLTVSRGEKDALARAALAHIEPGQVVLLDDSTTAGAVAPLLGSHTPLTVITNSLPAAATLTEVDGVTLICLGGQFHRTYNAYIGLICANAIEKLRASVLICSASAVSGTMAYIQDPEVVQIKQAMFAVCAKRILLLDHAKFSNSALHAFASLNTFDAVLVTEGIPETKRQELLRAGVALTIVKAKP